LRWELGGTRCQRLALGWPGWLEGRRRCSWRFRRDRCLLGSGALLEAGNGDFQRSEVALQLEGMLACLSGIAAREPGRA
jgi:hypothetical protein